MVKVRSEDFIVIDGLTEYRREIKDASPKLARELGKALGAAVEPIAKDARGRATSQGGALGKASKSIKAKRSQTGAILEGGGDAFPMFLGGEFGAKQYPQFEPWRGNQWPGTDVPEDVGYALHPALRDGADDLVDAIGNAIEDVYSAAFPDKK